MGPCLEKGGPPDTNDASPSQPIARLHRVARLSKVVRKGHYVIVKCIGVQLFNRGAGPLMQDLALLHQQRVVGDLACERVLKSEPDVTRAGLFVDELCELEVGKDAVQL